jgi:predicted kinase
MSGSPLSGKSILSKKIKKHFGQECFVISTDNIRKRLTGDYSDYSREFDVWAAIVKKAIKELNNKKVVVIDATLRQKDIRLKHIDYYKDYDIYYIAFEQLPFEVILERNQERTWKQLDEETLKKMYEGYEFPDEEELKLYKKSIVINNENSDLKLTELLTYIDEERRKT